ncbi:MAG: helix-turn-helix domain-containing protein, partial [Saprospiraceae bacterium]
IPLSEHQAVFNFCLKGKQSFTLTGNYLPTAANPSHSNVLLLPNETFTARTESQGEFVTATLYISLSKFLSILGDSVEILPKNFLHATEKNNVCYFKNHTWHPRIKQLVAQMQQHQFSPFAARIFLESKMLEIIAIMLELQHRAAESQQFIPKKDEEKIRYAREILEQDLANPPTLAHLARLIGSNEFTLKKGFKAIFGTPVYRFLQQLRMERAAELLQTTSLQVSEVALSVGYENVSAFTRAFREVYGALPSTMRKTPFRHN